ncbi:MAG: peroxiredoxin family protein [Fusobacteriaceae bacterium]
MKQKIRLVIEIVVVLGILWYGINYLISSKRYETKLNVGDKVQNFELIKLNGEKISIESFRGKKVLINFTATWCPYCNAEKKIFSPFYESVLKNNKNLETVIIFGDYGKDVRIDTKAKVLEYMKKNNYNFLIYYDENKIIRNMFGAKVIPTTFLIDENGIIIEKGLQFYTLPAFDYSKE